MKIKYLLTIGFLLSVFTSCNGVKSNEPVIESAYAVLNRTIGQKNTSKFDLKYQVIDTLDTYHIKVKLIVKKIL